MENSAGGRWHAVRTELFQLMETIIATAETFPQNEYIDHMEPLQVEMIPLEGILGAYGPEGYAQQ